jgi:hypothetical protein
MLGLLETTGLSTRQPDSNWSKKKKLVETDGIPEETERQYLILSVESGSTISNRHGSLN